MPFSRVEYSNDASLTYLEERALLGFELNHSAFGFIKTAVLTLGQVHRDTPIIRSGTHTGAGGSTTTLTDSAAFFLRLGVRTGDRLTNTTDSNAVWDIVTVDSDTQLTIRLNTGEGGDDDFDTSDAYVIERRNIEDAYVPFTTDVRVFERRLVNQLIFHGTVQEVVPGDEQGRRLSVVCVGHDEELRTGASQTNQSAAVRSEIIQDVIDEQVSGAFLFPRLAAVEVAPGFEHSPSDDTLSPDFAVTSRAALASFVDFAKSDAWCQDSLRDPTSPAIEQNVSDASRELVFPSAEGNLAQSFKVSSHMAISAVSLYLGSTGTIPTGNVYVRIESNDEDGEVGATPGNDVPSGKLVTPWAESRLLNMTDITAGGAYVNFFFTEPIALDDDNTYWLVLSYQEDNVTGYGAGVDFVRWFFNTAGGFADGYLVTYASNVWTAVTGQDFRFRVFEFQDMYLFYDISADTWEDQLSRMITNDALRAFFADTIAGGVGTIDDRTYVRMCNPIRGLDLLLENTAASAEYGAVRVRYFGDTGAKITGEHGAASSATVLTDTDKNFLLTSVVVGDIVHNVIDDSYGVITAITATTLTVQDLNDGGSNTFEQGEAWEVINLELVASGTDDGGAPSATILTDSTANFRSAGIRVGDLAVNTTDNVVGVISAVGSTTLTVAAGNMSWDNGDAYRILSRWRTLTLKDTDITWTVLDTVRLEWDIPSDWVPTTFNVNLGGVLPEASAPGATVEDLMFGYWLSIQVASVPATTAEVDLVTPLPGYGFTLLMANETERDVVLAAAGVHDGGASAVTLRDTSEDFINDHGIRVGDFVENLTDASTARITAIQTSGAGANRYDELVAVLAGGTDDDWDVGDQYRVTRDRFKLNYFRNGSRPRGRPASFGLTLRRGAPSAEQITPLLDWDFSRSGQPVVNRVTVVGRPGVGLTPQTASNLRAQRESGRVIFKRITDYSLGTNAELLDRALAEINRLSDRTNRGIVWTHGLPFYRRVLTRQSWTQDGISLLDRLDGELAGGSNMRHDGAGNASALQDTSQNFKRWGVEPGYLVENVTDGSQAVITGVSTTTNEGDTVTHDALTGGTEDDWDSADEYRVSQRRFVQVGDLLYVKVDDPDYIDDYYVVTALHYTEPDHRCELRVARNLLSPNVGDGMTAEEIFASVADTADQAVQRGNYP